MKLINIIKAVALSALLSTSANASISCAQVGPSITTDPINGAGIFTLKSFKGYLYMGMFGDPQSQVPDSAAMMYRYNGGSFEPVAPSLLNAGNLGESVCDMVIFKDRLYANTEKQGRLFSTEDGTSWIEENLPSPGRSIGCALAVFKDRIYSVESNWSGGPSAASYISYNESNDRNGWVRFPDSGETEDKRLGYLRELVVFNGILHGFSVDKFFKTHHHQTKNGLTWLPMETTPTRMFRGTPYGDTLWLGSSEFGGGTADIWTYDGTKYTKKFTPTGTKRKQSFSHIFKGTEQSTGQEVMIAVGSEGFKDDVAGEDAPSQLYHSRDNGETWQENNTCSFTRGNQATENVWAMDIYQGKIYIGASSGGKFNHQGYGQLFVINGVEGIEPFDGASPASFMPAIIMLLLSD